MVRSCKVSGELVRGLRAGDQNRRASSSLDTAPCIGPLGGLAWEVTGKKEKMESEVAQSCPTLWDPMDCSPPGSSIHGIFQARVLEWVAISFSNTYMYISNQTQISNNSVCFFFFILFYFIFKLHITVLVLPNIKMNPPQVYMCSPSWTLLPPPSPFHPSGSSQCTSPKHPVWCIEPTL